MDSSGVLMPLYEGLYNYIQTQGTEPIPMNLESALYELGRQPRWKNAQSLFQKAKRTPDRRYEKSWRRYTALTNRFAHRIDFHLGAPQLIAIWEHLGVDVSSKAEQLLLTMAPSGTLKYLPLDKLATENFIQLAKECERAVRSWKERAEPTRMDKELISALKKGTNSIMESLERDFPGLSAGVLYSMGYTAPGFIPSLPEQRDALNQNSLSQGLHEYAVRLMEMSLQVKNLSTQLHLLEMCGDEVVDVLKWGDALGELGGSKPVQTVWNIGLSLNRPEPI